MRRIAWIGGFLAALGLGAGAYMAKAGLATCGVLDVRLARSGCTATVRVENFRPMLFQTMALSAKSGRLVLFGSEARLDEARAAVVEVDLARRAEVSRRLLPIRLGAPDQMRVSADGARAVIFCERSGECAEGGAALSVPIDAPDQAAPLDGPEADVHRRAPPGAPDFPPGVPYRSIATPDGATIVGVDGGAGAGAGAGDSLVLANAADGAEIARIPLDPPLRVARFDRTLAASPSGRFVALLTTSNPPRLGVGTMVRVFDLAARKQVATITTDPGFVMPASPVFTADERGLVLAGRRNRPPATELAVFAVPGR